MSKKSIGWWFIGLGLVLMLAVLSILYYVYMFHSYELSKSPSDWAEFATYLSGTIGLCVISATLLMLIKTVKQQEVLISRQDDFIALEIEKMKKSNTNKFIESQNIAIYLYEHIEILDNFLSRVIDNLEPPNEQFVKAVNKKHPAMYSSLMMGGNNEAFSLINKLPPNIATNCFGAMAKARYVHDIISYNYELANGQDSAFSRLERKRMNLSEERVKDALVAAKVGLKHTQEFFDHANKIIE